MWVHATANVPVMEIQYAVPCEDCFVSEETVAAKVDISTTLLKETLGKYLA
jgi:hypothetical protein